jgi:hypothetical protein
MINNKFTFTFIRSQEFKIIEQKKFPYNVFKIASNNYKHMNIEFYLNSYKRYVFIRLFCISFRGNIGVNKTKKKKKKIEERREKK